MTKGGRRPGAGRPAGSKNSEPTLDAVLYVRCLPEELELFKAAAEAKGEKLTDWVRFHLTRAAIGGNLTE